MSRVLPCPQCGDHMWDHLDVCSKCQNGNHNIDSIYILESKIDSLQEKLDKALSQLKQCQNELQKYKKDTP